MDINAILSKADFTYTEALKQAIIKSKKSNLKIPLFTFNRSFQLKTGILREINTFLQDKKLEQNCKNITYQLQQYLRNYHCIESLVTVGSISILDGKKVFYTPLDILVKMFQENFPNKIEVHFWLTLPNRSVIDPTIISTLKLIEAKEKVEFPIKINTFSTVHYSSIKQQHKKTTPINYFPMLIG